MTYDYQCEKCGKTWEMFLSYAKRDEPLKEKHCEKGGCKVECGGKYSSNSLRFGGRSFWAPKWPF